MSAERSTWQLVQMLPAPGPRKPRLIVVPACASVTMTEAERFIEFDKMFSLATLRSIVASARFACNVLAFNCVRIVFTIELHETPSSGMALLGGGGFKVPNLASKSAAAELALALSEGVNEGDSLSSRVSMKLT